MAELIVITGGSHSGKTSVVEALARRGHEMIPEAAYEVIRELTGAHGLEAQAQRRIARPAEFQRLISRRQHEREQRARQSDATFVFCDRGLLDGVAYCRLAGVPWPDDLLALSGPAAYAHVFVLETLAAFDPRFETGRIHTHEDSLQVAALLEDAYRPAAGTLTRLAEAPVEQRVATIMEVVMGKT